MFDPQNNDEQDGIIPEPSETNSPAESSTPVEGDLDKASDVSIGFDENGNLITKVNGHLAETIFSQPTAPATGTETKGKSKGKHNQFKLAVDNTNPPKGASGPVGAYQSHSGIYLSVGGHARYEVKLVNVKQPLPVEEGFKFYSNHVLGERASTLLAAGATLLVYDHLFGIPFTMSVEEVG